MKYRLRLPDERTSHIAVSIVDNFVRNFPVTTLCQGTIPQSPLRLMQAVGRLETELAGDKVKATLERVPAEHQDEAGKVHVELLRVVRRAGRLALALEPKPPPPPSPAQREAARAAAEAADAKHRAIANRTFGDAPADLRERGRR